jgi:hypothetical protein
MPVSPKFRPPTQVSCFWFENRFDGVEVRQEGSLCLSVGVLLSMLNGAVLQQKKLFSGRRDVQYPPIFEPVLSHAMAFFGFFHDDWRSGSNTTGFVRINHIE